MSTPPVQHSLSGIPVSLVLPAESDSRSAANELAQHIDAFAQRKREEMPSAQPGSIGSRFLQHLAVVPDERRVNEDGRSGSSSGGGDEADVGGSGDQRGQEQRGEEPSNRETAPMQRLPVAVDEPAGGAPPSGASAHPAPEQTQSYWSSVKSIASNAAGWLWRNGGGTAVASVGVNAAVGTVKAANAANAAFVERPDRPDLVRVSRDLEAATGSQHLAKAIRSVVPYILDTVMPDLLKLIQKLGNTTAIPLLQESIEGTLLCMARNLIAYNEVKPLHPRDPNKNSVVLDAVTQLIHAANEEIPEFDRKLAEIEVLNRRESRSATRVGNLQTILHPLTTRILEMALPKGEDSIVAPWPINKILWTAISEILAGPPSWLGAERVEAILLKLLEVYHEMKDPLLKADKDREALARMPGGGRLTSLCAYLTQEAGPQLALEEIGRTLAKNSPAYAADIMNAADSQGKKIIRISPELEGWLQSWFRNRIADVGNCKDDDIVKLMKFAGKYVEAMLLHSLVKLAGLPGGAEAGGADVSAVIVAKLLGTVVHVLRNRAPELKAKHQEVQAASARLQEALTKDDAQSKALAERLKEEIIVKEAEFESLFRPVSDELLRAAGLDNDAELPVPAFLRSLVAPALKQQAPKVFFELYSKAQLYLDLIKPAPLTPAERDKLKGNEHLNKCAQVILERIEPELRELVAEDNRKIAEWVLAKTDDQLQEVMLNFKYSEGTQERASRLLSENEVCVLSDLVKRLALSHAEGVQETWGFLKSEAQTLLVQILNNLALSNPLLIDFSEVHSKKDILTAAFIHILGISGGHFSAINSKKSQIAAGAARLNAQREELQRLRAELARIRDAERVEGESEASLAKIKALTLTIYGSGDGRAKGLVNEVNALEEELDGVFRPIVKDLISACRFKDPLPVKLCYQILPGLICGMYVDMMIEQPMPEPLKARLAALDSNGKLPEICRVFSGFLTGKLQQVLNGSGQAISASLNKEVFKNKLPAEQQAWLGSEIDALAGGRSPTVQQFWEFFQGYSQKLMQHLFAHLALSYQPQPGVLALNQDILSNSTLQLIHILNQHSQAVGPDGMTLERRLFAKVQQLDALPSGPDKESLYKDILKLLGPIAAEVLQSAGLKEAGDLPVPFLKNVLWGELKDTLLPALMLDIYREVQIKSDMASQERRAADQLGGHQEVKQVAAVLAGNIIPAVVQQVAGANARIAGGAVEALAENGLAGVDPNWIANTVTQITRLDNAGIKNAWSFVEQFLARQIYGIAAHAAGAGQAGAGLAAEDMLQKLVMNVLRILHNNLQGRQEAIDAAIEEYDKSGLMASALSSVQQMLEAKQLGEKRRALLKNTFGQAVNDVLHLTGLNNEETARLPWAKFYLGLIKDELLPQLFLGFYRQGREPLAQADRERAKLGRMPGGENLLHLCRILTEQAGPKYLPPAVAEKSTDIAKAIMEATDANGQRVMPNSPAMEEWVRNQIALFGQCRHQDVADVWSFAGKYAEAMFVHALLKLAGPHSDGAAPADVTAAIFAKFLSAAAVSFRNNSERIKAKFQEVEEIKARLKDLSRVDAALNSELAATLKQSQSAKEGELENLFRPISEEMLRLAGLDRDEELPVPPFIRKLVKDILNEQSPKLFMEMYSKAKLYLDLAHPAALTPGQAARLGDNGHLQRFSQAIMDIVEPKITANLDSCRQDIAAAAIGEAERKFPGLGLNDNERALLADFVRHMALGNEEGVALVRRFAFDEAKTIILQILNHLAASNPVFRELSEANSQRDVLHAAFMHILAIGAHHLPGIKPQFDAKLVELNGLRGALARVAGGDAAALEQKRALEVQIQAKDAELDLLFKPIIDDLAAACGLIKDPIQQTLCSSILPGLIRKSYADVMVAQPLPEDLQQRLAALDPNGKLPDICRVISTMLKGKLQQALNGAGKGIAEALNKEILGARLPREQEAWLGAEIDKAAAGRSQAVAQMWGFVQGYSQKLLHHVFAHLALSYAPAPGAQLPAQDILSNIMMQVLYVIGKHAQSEDDRGLTLDRRLSAKIQQMDALQDGPDKSNLNREILGLLKPAALEILQSAGLGNATDLPVPDVVREPLWDSLSSALLPELLMDLYREIQLKSILTLQEQERIGRLEGHADFKDGIDVVCRNLTPFMFQALADNSNSLARELKDLLADHGMDAVEQMWIENALRNMAQANSNPAVQGAWNYVENFLAGRLYGAAAHAALAAPGGDQAAANHRNILSKVILNVLKVLRTDLAGRKPVLDAAVVEYDKLAPLIEAMGAAKKLMAAKHAEVVARLRAIKSAQPAVEQSARIAELLDACVDEMLQRLGMDAGQRQRLAGLAREFLMRPVQNPPETDREILRTLIFGSLSFAVAEAQDGQIEQKVVNAREALADQLRTSEDRKKALLNESFGKAVMDVLQLAGLDRDENAGLPGAGRFYGLNEIKEVILPQLFLSMYRDVTRPQSMHDAYKRRLNELLYDPISLPRDMNAESSRELLQQPYQNLEQFRAELWKKAGTAQTGEFIDNACPPMARDIAQVVQNYLKEEPMEVAANMNSLLPVQFSNRTVGMIADAIRDLASSSNEPEISDAFGYFQKIVETGLLKVLVNIGESTQAVLPPPLGENPAKTLIANVIYRVFGIAAKHREAIKARMQEAYQLPEGSLARQQKLREIFKPVSDELVQAAGLQPLADLPVPANLKKDLWDALTKKAIPDLVAKMYLETTAWELEAVQNQQKLQRIYGTTHAPHAVRVISQFATEAAQSYLATESNEAASIINAALKRYLDIAGTPQGQLAGAYLDSAQSAAKQIVGNNIQQLAVSNDPAMQWVWPSANEYMNSVLMKVFGNMSGKIAGIEQGRPDFLADTALRMLKLFTSHFVKINEITKASKVKSAYKVDSITMLEGFQNPGANPLDADHYNVAASKEFLEAKIELKGAMKALRKEKKDSSRKNAAQARVDSAQEKLDKIRKEKYFVPLTAKFLELADLRSAADLPFPSPIKEQLWDLLKSELVPSVLGNLYKTIMDPSTLNSMMLNSIQALNDAMSAIPDDDDAGPVPAPEAVDNHEQKEFNKACGELVLALVNMVPETLTKSVFKFDRVKRMTAEAVGRAMRNELGKWTMLKVIDQGLFKGLPSLAPGAWEGALNNENFVSKAVVDGKVTNQNASLKFNLPVNAQEKKQHEDLKANQAQETRGQLKRALVKILHDQIKSIIQSFFSSNWQHFHDVIDREIQKHCGNFGLDVKKFLDVVFDKIFFKAMGTVLQILGYPLYKLFWLIMDLHLGWKSEEIIKDLNMEIHENLFYSMTNELFNSVKAHQAPPAN